MSNEQLFIPDKLKVGFQERGDTYTGQLAYVIYYDKKGVLRKEASWQSWRSKKIEAKELTNEPTEGFVLNKHGGGKSYGWHSRNAFCRIYDPRNFEFEISIENLLFILKECDCNKGKGLEGKFVYAWEGTSLILLPTGCQEYKSSAQFSELQGQGVKHKDLILGASYISKKQESLIYLGRFDYFFALENKDWSHIPIPKADQTGVATRYIFWNGKEFRYLKDLKSLATLVSETVTPDYADLVDKYNKSCHGSRVVSLFLKEVDDITTDTHEWGQTKTWHEEGASGVYQEYDIWMSKDQLFDPSKPVRVNNSTSWFVKNKVLYRKSKYNAEIKKVPGNNQLFAKLENGSEIPVTEALFKENK